jgi:hypothetical protein
MKNALTSCLVFISLMSVAHADMFGVPVTTALYCVAVNSTKTMDVSVYSDERGTELIIDGSRISSEQLTTGSEGNVYIQQVTNSDGYNISLAGDLLDSLFPRSTEYINDAQIDGRLWYQGAKYSMTCEGGFGLNQCLACE